MADSLGAGAPAARDPRRHFSKRTRHWRRVPVWGGNNSECTRFAGAVVCRSSHTRRKKRKGADPSPRHRKTRRVEAAGLSSGRGKKLGVRDWHRLLRSRPPPGRDRAQGEGRKVNPRRKVRQGEGKMAYRRKQSWPADRIQRRLRVDEALMQIVRAQRVFLASRKPDIDAPIARQKEPGLTRT